MIFFSITKLEKVERKTKPKTIFTAYSPIKKSPTRLGACWRQIYKYVNYLN